MANWQEKHREDLESGKIYFQEAAEVTLPRGYRVVWITYEQTKEAEHRHRRPEMKIKDTNEADPKVFAGNFSGVGQHRHSRFSWWMVSHPIDVTPGLITRAKAQVMIMSHGINKDDSRPGDGGMRVGIVDADVISLLDDDLTLSREQAEELAVTAPPDWDKLFEQNPKLSKWDVRSEKVTPQILKAMEDKTIVWSDWWGVRGSLKNENIWKPLQTDVPPPEDGPQPPFKPKGNKVRLILQHNELWPVGLSAGHYDDLIVEQDLDSEPAPPPPPPPPKNLDDDKPVPPPVEPPASGRAALIDAALALQAQAKMLLEMDPPMTEAALELYKQAGILLQMAK